MQTDVSAPRLLDPLTVAVVKVGMQLPALSQRYGEANAQLPPGACQVAVELMVIDLGIIVSGKLMGISQAHIGLGDVPVTQVEVAPHGRSRLAQQ
ncbi:hypothetical protein D3C78_1586060 [compost metagenome]